MVNVPLYTYDLTTDVGVVRLLAQDNDMSATSMGLPLERRSVAFSDQEIQAMINIAGPNLLEAAAMVLRTWANNKQLIVTARKFARGEVSYGDIRDYLLKAAKSLEDRAAMIPADAFAEMSWTDFAAEQIIIGTWARE